MKTAIVVEARKDPNVRHILDAIADVCSALGHNVRRWRGPLSGRVPHSRRLPPSDLVIFFNGTHASYAPWIDKSVRSGASLLFVEMGWHPQQGTLQIDPCGINSAASWASAPLQRRPTTRLSVRAEGDLLLLLQDDADTQITHRSPWFANMAEFVEHVGRYSKLSVRVRAHPRHAPDPQVFETIDRLDLELDLAATLTQALEACKAVACVNSSGAVEALADGLPVLCYGNSIYRHRGAVYCLENDPRQTMSATEALEQQVSELSVESVDEVLARIRESQWTVDEITIRLPPLVEAVLAERRNSQPPEFPKRRGLLAPLHNTLWRNRRAG